MHLKPVLHSIQLTRLHHCYRPIQYCDWHKPPNTIYYVLKCPPCPPPKAVKPIVIYAKTCKLCSFLEQVKDQCCGFFWPLPPMPIKTEGRVYVCKDLRQQRDLSGSLNLTMEESQARFNRKLFKLDECPDIPDCPLPNWERFKAESSDCKF